MIINILLTASCLIDIIFILHIVKDYNRLPLIISIPLILFSIITFFSINPEYYGIHLLDIEHPVYSDPNDVSTISILIALAGGLALTTPFTLSYQISLATQTLRTKIRNKKEEK